MEVCADQSGEKCLGFLVQGSEVQRFRGSGFRVQCSGFVDGILKILESYHGI